MPFEIPPFTLPVWILLVFFGAFLAFFLLYTVFNFYHLLRFGTYGMGLYAVTAFFFAGTVLLVAGSATLLLPFDWTYGVSPVALFEGSNADKFFLGK